MARDALAVLTALRPAAMLDYAVLDAATLRAVGSALRTAAPEAGLHGSRLRLMVSGHTWCGFTLDHDCCPLHCLPIKRRHTTALPVFG